MANAVYEVRPAKGEEIESAANLVTRVFAQEGINAKIKTQEYLEKLQPKHQCSVAIYDGKVVGALFYSIEESKGNIIDVAVDPSHRRRGVSKELARISMEDMQKRNAIVVQSDVVNNDWARYLQELGFEDMSFSDSERAIPLQKRF